MGNHQNESMEYIENWVAHMFQKPEDKPGVCIVLKGGKGVGKDTFGDAVGALLGLKLFWNTASPEHDIFSSFNGCAELALLVKFEEANFETNKANAEKLKTIISSPLYASTHKGQDQVVLKNYSRYIFTTNNDVPCVVNDGERRFAMFEVSDEKKGDFPFWNQMYKDLPAQGPAYMYYLLNKDITKFEPKQYPETEYLEEVRQAFIPQIAKWFQRQMELNIDQEKIEWYARDMYMLMNREMKFPVSETKYGRDMKQFVANGVMEKIKHSQGNKYIVTVKDMCEFLQKKGWWFEL
jgi:hypothetical protein